MADSPDDLSPEGWVIVYDMWMRRVAVPACWAKPFAAVSETALTLDAAQRVAELLVGPGSHHSALRCIGDLHVAVTFIYNLIDEGIILADKAHLAFASPTEEYVHT